MAVLVRSLRLGIKPSAHRSTFNELSCAVVSSMSTAMMNRTQRQIWSASMFHGRMGVVVDGRSRLPRRCCELSECRRTLCDREERYRCVYSLEAEFVKSFAVKHKLFTHLHVSLSDRKLREQHACDVKRSACLNRFFGKITLPSHPFQSTAWTPHKALGSSYRTS